MEWQGVALLGAYHGINPGMGWLFAVALGMQQGSAQGVWRALPPIAIGHGLAVGVVLAIAAALQLVVPLDAMKIAVASILIAFGLYRLWRHRHPVYGGMQVGFRDLTIWSFLMASAHGAGFMVLPLVMGASTDVHAASAGHAHGVAVSAAGWPLSFALGVHTFTYLAVTALIAWIIYSRVGLAILRTAWFNLDWLWSCVLVVTGTIVLLV
jgi:uncharacterized membrane protein (UPF0136 family)